MANSERYNRHYRDLDLINEGNTMKLDRNKNTDGRGKYGIVKRRRLDEILNSTDRSMDAHQHLQNVKAAISLLESSGVIEWGPEGSESEFFVIKLRDEFAGVALSAYANEARNHGMREYATDVTVLANRSGCFSPFCKKPD